MSENLFEYRVKLAHAAKVELHIPDENSRRVGQSVAAASLPEMKK